MRTFAKVLAVLMVVVAACSSDAPQSAAPTTHGSSPPETSASSSSAPTSSSGPPAAHVRWIQQGPPITPGTPACDAAGGCVFPFEQRGTLSGDVTGSSVGAGTAVLPANGREKTFAVIATMLVRGSFAGCGQGVAVVRRWETVDPETGAAAARWEIAGAVGDGVAAVSGSGTIAPAPAGAGGVASTWEGEIRCEIAVTPAASSLLPSDDGSRAVEVTVAIPPPAVGAPVCDESDVCLYPAPTTTTLAGDFAGAAVGNGVAYLVSGPDAGYVAASLELFRGSITGCGDGTAVVRTVSRRIGARVEQQWDVVPGYGTGALAHLTGGGSAVADVAADNSYAGTRTGRIDCPQS
jgi:hypothetical protein